MGAGVVEERFGVSIAPQCVAVCCSVLQYAAVCCSVLQCAAVCCSVLQCAAVCRSVLQCVAVCCSVLQCAAVRWMGVGAGVAEERFGVGSYVLVWRGSGVGGLC